MNKSFLLLSTALLLTSTSIAFAASTAELKVKGLITPSACEPGLSSGGVVDHGKRSVNDLNQNGGWTLLGNQTLQLTITCGAPTLIALQGIDNKGDAPDPYSAYGLGLVDGIKLGQYTLVLENPMDGGAAIGLIQSADGLTWTRLWSDDVWQTAHLASFGDRSTGSWAPTPVQNVTIDLRVQTTIAPTAGMNLANEIPIDGSATLEVKYL